MLTAASPLFTHSRGLLMTGLLHRCIDVYDDRLERTGALEDPGPPCLAAVLEHLAAEIIAEANRCPALTAHQVAGRLLDAAKEVA
jgi:hypothetical protein